MQRLKSVGVGLLGAVLLAGLYALAVGIFGFPSPGPTFGVDAYTSTGQLFAISLSATVLLLAAMIGFAVGFAWMRRRQTRGRAAGAFVGGRSRR